MDIIKAQELSELASKQIELAQAYVEARQRAGEAKTSLELILTANIKDILDTKRNAGYEMALLILMADNIEAKEFFAEMRKYTEKYKGLEKLIEAHQSKISLEQSIMKYILKGETYGA